VLPLLALLALSCSPDAGQVHSLAFGGDLFLGRGLNPHLHRDPQAVLRGLEPLLSSAEIAVVNAEGVIAAGGAFADKGEPRPYTFRAVPAAFEMLEAAGVDLLLLGNNHSGDYGPDALLEMRDRALLAGIDVAGGGQDLAEARTPSYHQLGDLVVAVVGVDLTGTRRYRAKADRPGSLVFQIDQPQRSLEAIAGEAREHAQVLLLAPHWGPAFLEAPAPEIRALARELIDAGYDGILGHGSHRFQGAELVDGKPVLYDAGNLVPDFPGAGPNHQGLLYTLRFDRRGVVEVQAHPVHAAGADTRVAEGREASDILQAWAARSEALGSSVELDAHAGRLICEPGVQRGPRGSPEPPARALPAALRAAPPRLILEALPPTALPAAVRFDNGVELLGYELLLDRLRRPKAGQVVTLYLRDQWPPGAIVRDQSLMRLVWEPEGTVEFWAGLEGVGVEASDLPVDGAMVLLGQAPYADQAPRIFELYRPPP
jgi:poly-gamma-glutamate capsule biosynthesis protein CapA/YwtB (metallophosphatase superfamily)